MPNKHLTRCLRGGINLREALQVARQLGCVVDWPRRTGEVRVRHVLSRRPLRLSARRKDSPRALVTFLRHLLVAA